MSKSGKSQSVSKNPSKQINLTREESYQLFLEEKDYEVAIFNKIENATIEQLAECLTSPIEEERWLAEWRLKQLNKNT